MTNNGQELQTQTGDKQEVAPVNGAEYTYTGKTYVPHTDIYETDEAIIVIADMPGVDEHSVDITLEKNILSLHGRVTVDRPDNYSLAYAEYDVGDYQRRFTLSDEIDHENIEAVVKDGVLRLQLVKADPAKTRKIAIKAA